MFAPYDPYVQDLANRTVPPVWYDQGAWLHPLGTDQLGRDYLSRLIYGGRISLLIGVSVAVISGLIGTTMGMLAGYFGGKTDMAGVVPGDHAPVDAGDPGGAGHRRAGRRLALGGDRWCSAC